MANRTAKYAVQIHGADPQERLGNIIRKRIYLSKYWSNVCVLLTSAGVLERAVDDIRYVGSTYGDQIYPTPFLCLALKLLQIQPKKEIIYLYIEQTDFKYLRALGAFYLRLTGRPVEIYQRLEPLYNDYRKLRIMDSQRQFSVIHMDEFIDNLLREDKVLNVSLPRLTKRDVLERNRDIELYRSELEERNLIPTNVIKEKIERQRRGRDYRDEHDEERREHRSSSHHHRPSASSRRRYEDDRSRRRHERSGDGREQDRGRRRDRSRSPSGHEKNLSSKYTSGNGRFSREEIAKENAIRAKVGLKPLK